MEMEGMEWKMRTATGFATSHLLIEKKNFWTIEYLLGNSGTKKYLVYLSSDISLQFHSQICKIGCQFAVGYLSISSASRNLLSDQNIAHRNGVFPFL